MSSLSSSTSERPTSATTRWSSFAKARTAKAIADWLSAHVNGGATTEAAPAPSPAPSGPAPDIRAPQRLEMHEVEATFPDAADFCSLSGARFLLLGGEGDAAALADAVTERLRAYGAGVVAQGEAEGVILLGGLTAADGEPLLPAASRTCKAALVGGPRWFLAAGGWMRTAPPQVFEA